ncbi:MAG: MASE3 domain-containing protein [Chloroflexota bacterium]|nr:MASE3 domain-containing protein [Chloroflexota bacterium]
MSEQSFVPSKYIPILIAVLVLAGLYLTSLYSYLLFHSLVEVFSIVIACGIFMVAWNSRRLVGSDYLMILGVAYLFVGGMDLLHTLAYEGMGVFQGYDANLPTQLWIAARYLEGFSLLIVPLFLTRKANRDFVFAGYTVFVGLLLGAIFWDVFPDCYIEGMGLTPFKKISEYVISLIFLASIALLVQRRKEFDLGVLRLLVSSIVVKIVAELAFTFYTSVYGFFNLVGHLLKIVSFYLTYKAIIETGFTEPYNLLFRNLKQGQDALQKSESRYRTLFDSASDAIFIHDLTGRFLEVNRVACERLGYSREELLQMTLADIDLQESVATMLERIEELRQRGQVFFDVTHVRRDGVIIPAELNSRVIEYDGNQVVLSIARDITERKRAEMEVTRLAEVMRQASETIVITDLDGNIVYANPYFEVSTGYTAAEMLGQNPRILKSGHQDQAFYRAFWETIVRGETWRGVFVNRRKDGALYHEEATVFPIKDATGKIINYAAVKWDITKRKQAEDALQQRNRELALLNRVGQELAATLDLQSIAEQLLQEITEIVGAEGASSWLWDEEQGGWLVCQAAFHRGQSRPPVNMRLRSGQGVAGWVAQEGKSVIVANTHDDSRFFSGIDEQTGFRTNSMLVVPLRVRETVIGVLEVVNKQRGGFSADDRALAETLAASAAIAIENARLIETLRQHMVELEARNEELDAFAHTVAHDLKNPLAHIIGLAEVLGEEYTAMPDQELGHYLHKMAKNGRKMDSIINELLLLAVVYKLEEVEMRPLDMASIVAEVTRRLAFMITEYQAEIILPETWPVAVGYGPWVEEVWANYLSNALKYGGRPPRVELGATSLPAPPGGGELARFWVRDNGPGLTPEEHGRLFTPFTRLDQVQAKGHGLGLSIVRRIVDKLNGQVSVESKVGQGSVFSFTLPAIGD